MAPKLAREETLWTIDTLVKLSFTEKYRNQNLLVLEKDPIPAAMDTLAPGTMDSDEITIKHPIQ